MTEELRSVDLFPDMSDEIDRRISFAEMRIKYWVLIGVITNFIIAVGAAIPVIYASGTISADIRQSTSTQNSQAIEIAANRKWIQDRMIWEAKVEAAMAAHGIHIGDQQESPQ